MISSKKIKKQWIYLGLFIFFLAYLIFRINRVIFYFTDDIYGIFAGSPQGIIYILLAFGLPLLFLILFMRERKRQNP